MKNKYICSTCNKSIMLDEKPFCCPFCGEKTMICKTMNTVIAKIQAMQVILPDLYEAERAYSKLWCEFEDLRQGVAPYTLASRGKMINKEDIPKYIRKPLTEYFKEYRKERNR